MAKAHPTLTALRAACKGLVYASETDAPVKAFAWPGGGHAPTAADVLARSEAAADSPVEESTVAAFFRGVPKAAKADYLHLAGVLADHLSGAKVFLVGEVRRTAYVVGTAADGTWAGVTTQLVET